MAPPFGDLNGFYERSGFGWLNRWRTVLLAGAFNGIHGIAVDQLAEKSHEGFAAGKALQAGHHGMGK